MHIIQRARGRLNISARLLSLCYTTYCYLGFKKEWDEGVHLLLYAVPEVIQESLGFSQEELVFAHTVWPSEMFAGEMAR